MSEERPVSREPKAVESAVAPELEAPGSSTEVAVKTAEAERRSKRESSSSARRRGRMALRIPDDEVARPQIGPEPAKQVESSSAPPPPQSRSEPPVDKDAAVIPTRIISINPESTAEASPAVEVPPAPAVPRTVQEDSWTPFQPSVADSASSAPVQQAESNLASEDVIALDSDSSSPSDSEEAPESIEPIEDAEAPAADEDEDGFDGDRPTPVITQLAIRPTADGERRSDPGDAPEISLEDMVAEESLPPMRLKAPSQPPTPPPARKPALPKAPLVIVPPHLGIAQPQPPEGSGLRRKGRLWWEDLFNDDYVRTMEKITDEQIAREVDFIEESLGVERGGAMLDLACGTGRHAIDLARRGYEVVGFDLSLAMLARAGEDAQEREAKLNFVQGDMREMTFDEQFDGVYSWNTSFGYFEEDRNAHVVDRIHRALKAGGMFLLDVVNRDFLIRQSPSLVWFEGDGCVCMDEMSVDFITSRMRIKRTMMLDDGRSREIEYSMRVYSLHELGKMLHEHGFKVTEVSGRTATPGVFFGNESPRTIIRAEKR